MRVEITEEILHGHIPCEKCLRVLEEKFNGKIIVGRWDSLCQAIILGDKDIRPYFSWLVEANLFPYLSLRNYDFRDVDLSEVNFQYLDLSYVDFSGAKLSNSDFSFSRCLHTKFNGADLTDSNFYGSKCLSTEFKKANMLDSYFDDADLKDVDFSHANLIGSQFNGASGKRCIFTEKTFFTPDFSDYDPSIPRYDGFPLIFPVK